MKVLVIITFILIQLLEKISLLGKAKESPENPPFVSHSRVKPKVIRLVFHSPARPLLYLFPLQILRLTVVQLIKLRIRNEHRFDWSTISI